MEPPKRSRSTPTPHGPIFVVAIEYAWVVPLACAQRSRPAATRCATPTPCTMADVALDANVLVAWLDAADALHGKAKDLLDRLRAADDAPLTL